MSTVTETVTITKAVQQNGWIDLTLQPIEGGDAFPYALTADDPYGWAPELRDELQRMVDAGEIVIEPAPLVVEPLPADNGAPQ